MKSFIQKPVLTLATLLLAGHLGIAKADTASDTETILNWAENTFSDLFPSHQATQSIDPWLFRFYPETGIYAGVNLGDNGVYVLGGPWETVTLIDTLPNVVNLALGSGNTGISGCNTASVPAGISYSQSGNVVTVTSNGQCIPIPNITDPSITNLCQVPEQTSATGISVLGTNDVGTQSLEGITSNSMFPIESILGASADVQYCTINAPTSTADLIVNTDLCFDITQQFTDFQFDGITITPPVNYRLVSTATSTVVPDCFATDASVISDAFTGETWVKNPLTGTFDSTGN